LNIISENDKEKQLSTITSNIENMHAKGKINNEYYTNLKKEASILYQEIFKRRIDSLNSPSNSNKEKLFIQLKDDLSDAYSKGQISELQYSLLKEKLSTYEKT
jgi:hypothetical protein